MKDFRALMSEKYTEDELRLGMNLESSKYRPRIYKGLFSPSGVELSIQASSMHYCYPRKTVDIMEYKSFEVACFASNESSGFSNLFDITGDHSFEEYESDGVYADVPVAKVQELCEILGIVG